MAAVVTPSQESKVTNAHSELLQHPRHFRPRDHLKPNQLPKAKSKFQHHFLLSHSSVFLPNQFGARRINDMSTQATKLTYQDYVCFPDDGKRHEIIDGTHFMNPAPSIYHQQVSRRLQFQLYAEIELRELGVVIDAPVDVQITDHDIVQPDLVVVLSENRIITPTKVKGAPNHVIEILSPSTEVNDKTLKRQLFEQAGVPEYWIVDPADHSVLQLVLKDGKYAETKHSKQITLSYLDVSVDLSQVW